MNKFSTSAATVKPSSIIKVYEYPPDISRTLLDKVAMSDPPMTVKVINAILVGKCFIP